MNTNNTRSITQSKKMPYNICTHPRAQVLEVLFAPMQNKWHTSSTHRNHVTKSHCNLFETVRDQPVTWSTFHMMTHTSPSLFTLCETVIHNTDNTKKFKSISAAHALLLPIPNSICFRLLIQSTDKKETLIQQF